MSFSRSHDGTEAYRRAAHYVEKILQSAKVSDLPFELPTKFDLVINVKVAETHGVPYSSVHPVPSFADDIR
jgi:putative ABC transport system substrate-binding protein